MPHKIPAPKIQRKRPKFKENLIAQHSRQAGEVITAWNILHYQMFMIFMVLMGNDNYRLCYGLWHCIKNDSAQIEMVKASAVATLPPRSKVLANILWIVSCIESIRSLRNAITHTAIIFYFDQDSQRTKIAYDAITAMPHAIKTLANNPTHKIWRRLIGDLWALSQYAGYAINDLTNRENPHVRMSSPRRPRMLVAKPSPSRSVRSRRAKDAKAFRRQPRPSRP